VVTGSTLTALSMMNAGLGLEFTFTSAVVVCSMPVMVLSAMFGKPTDGLTGDLDLGVVGRLSVMAAEPGLFSLTSLEMMFPSFAVGVSLEVLRASSVALLVLQSGETVLDASEAMVLLISETLCEVLIV